MKHLLTFLFVILSLFSVSQQKFSNDIRFAGYLLDKENYDDAIYVLSDLQTLRNLSGGQKDTLNYMLGWSYYNVKSLESSVSYLARVSNQSPFYQKSKFYEIFNHVYLQETDTAQKLLDNSVFDDKYQQLVFLEEAGIALLNRRYEQYEKVSENFNYSFYAVSEEQKELDHYYEKLVALKRKSPVVAGLLSAVVPGSGKLYAGYKGKAAASFLQVAALGAVGAESYIKAGPTSPQFLIFASLFAIVYTGNIWGSVLSVQLKRDETLREIDHNIVFDLHIPLRRVFE